MQSDTKSFFKLVLFFVLGVAMLTLSSIAVGLINKKPGEDGQLTATSTTIIQTVIKEVPVTRPECPHDLLSYQELLDKGQYVTLIRNTRGYSANGRVAVSIPDRNLVRNGFLACGYVFVRAERAPNKPLDTKTESISINPHERGGHLFRLQSIVPDSIDETKVLLPLDEIRYKSRAPYTVDPQNPELQDANWVDLINSGEVTRFIFIMSTLSTNAKLNEVTIAYKCWNPDTGKETEDCGLKDLASLVKP